jgi:endogenous inhibitor of DNA gyrase (YacG/DUF329 family)
MPTLNNIRKPNTRENTATPVACSVCGLTEKQIAILGLLHCCGGPEIPDTQLLLIRETPISTIARNQQLFTDPNSPARPLVARSPEQLPAPVEPYSTIVITKCDDCGGDGADHSQRDDYYPCEFCSGSGEQAVLRNWLGEAFQIESGLLAIEPQREHLTALRLYATQVLNVYNSEHAREVA